MSSMEALMPPTPKRRAAQMSRGMGAYSSAGEVSGPAGVQSKARSPSARMPTARNAASRIRAGGTLNSFVESRCTPIRMAGTSTTAVTPFEMPRLRHSTQ